MYHFEEVIRAVSGRQDFTLPYWDVTDPNQRTIPKPFLSPKNGGFPGLYDPDRGKSLSDPSKPVVNLNDGITTLASSERYDPALNELTQVQNSGYELFNQAIDHAPHGGPHIDIDGKMLDLKTAALDPIFWVHHANIDRLWAEYSKDAVNARWFSQLQPGITFGFFDQNGEEVTYTYKQAARAIYRLDYDYDTGANTLKPDNQFSPTRHEFISRRIFHEELASFDDQELILRKKDNASIQSKKANKRTVLSVTLDSCHDTTGHIDILFSNKSDDADDAITHYTFEQLKERNSGTFLDQHYAGTVNFIPHGVNVIGSGVQHDHNSSMHSKNCGEKKAYLFDITDELNASGASLKKPIIVTFNIDPGQNSSNALDEVFVSSVAMYNVF